MEEAVKFFVIPVHQKAEGKPFEILQFADKKVCGQPLLANH
jgi:hypothetical protein